MVTTRSAARREAAAASAAATSVPADTNGDSAPHLSGTPNPDSSTMPSANPPTSVPSTAPSASAPSSAACDPPAAMAARRRSLHLSLGHTVAFMAVTITAHAASLPAHLPHPLHACLLLLSTIPLRLGLALPTQNTTSRPQGVRLAVSAAPLFASNALHLLAMRASPSLIPALLVPAALNASAVWLHMAVIARAPTRELLAVPLAILEAAADIFLAARIARWSTIQTFSEPFLWLRVVADLRLLLVSAVAVIRRDEAANRRVTSPDGTKEHGS